VRTGSLSWTGSLQPTPLSVIYTVRLEYDERDPRPRVTVLDPPLERPAGKSLPHVYEGEELCLYYDEFDCEQDLLADTVVPWASEWLYYYESWVTTGEWHGGGIHPEDLPPPPRRVRRQRERSSPG
jgi:hypothetical protein